MREELTEMAGDDPGDGSPDFDSMDEDTLIDYAKETAELSGKDLRKFKKLDEDEMREELKDLADNPGSDDKKDKKDKKGKKDKKDKKSSKGKGTTGILNDWITDGKEPSIEDAVETFVKKGKTDKQALRTVMKFLPSYAKKKKVTLICTLAPELADSTVEIEK